MASIAARPLRLVQAGVAVRRIEHAGQQGDVSRRAEGMDARCRQGEVHAAVDRLVGGHRFVPRRRPALSPGLGQGAPVGPAPPGDGLDDHDADVAFGAEGEELLGRLPVLGSRPQCGIDGEHDGVEIEAAQRLEVRPRHLHVVPGDAGEAGVARVAQRNDPLQRGGAAVQLGQRGDGMGLVEIEHLGVEQPARRVELVGHAIGIGPQRLAGDEDLVAACGQVRTDHRFGRPVLRRDVEVVHPTGQRLAQPRARLFLAGVPAGGATENGHAALVAGPAQTTTFHPDRPSS